MPNQPVGWRWTSDDSVTAACTGQRSCGKVGFPSMTPPSRSLRGRLREARRTLDPTARAAASDAVARHLRPMVDAAPARVAAYVAADGEIEIAGVLDALRTNGTAVALPRLAADGPTMAFHLVADDHDLVPGEWGLLEPPPTAPVLDSRTIDVVLTPLVGFDEHRNRIGRGRGYYDRHFAFLADEARPTTPVLVGIAHELQLVPELPVRDHDIPLDTVVTPERVRGHFPW